MGQGGLFVLRSWAIWRAGWCGHISGPALQGGDTKVFPGLWEFWNQNFWTRLGPYEWGGLALAFMELSSWESFLISTQVTWHWLFSPHPLNLGGLLALMG